MFRFGVLNSLDDIASKYQMIPSVELFILVLLLGFLKQWRREREEMEDGAGRGRGGLIAQKHKGY